jgi:ribonucleoside-diphosphate reductase alpha chain
MKVTTQIMSDLVVWDKYARYVDDKQRRETYEEIVTRSKEMHIAKFPALTKEIEDAFSFVYKKEVLPSMRSFQFAGKAVELNNARLYNCSFMPINHTDCFKELMFLLLTGCGVGYSVEYKNIKQLPTFKPLTSQADTFTVPDTIEGWADSIDYIFSCFVQGLIPSFDYSLIRAKGTRLVVGGGKAPGSAPLKHCHLTLFNYYNRVVTQEKSLTSLAVHDFCCIISSCVVAGGIRRSAMIALFDLDDTAMINCKSGADWFVQHSYRGMANNSAVVDRYTTTEEQFKSLFSIIEDNNSGEPGIYFTNNSAGDYGANPCVEISLRNNTFCNLVEVPVSADIKETQKRVKAATFIATLQASYTNFVYLRPIWKTNTEEDALIGVGLTNLSSSNFSELEYNSLSKIIKTTNKETAALININTAARTTCVKPSGTASLVLGTASGIHAWYANYYIRRIRVELTNPLFTYFKETMPELTEIDSFNTDNGIIMIPMEAPEGVVIGKNETAISFLERVKACSIGYIQPGTRYGLNHNNVSATVSIKKEEYLDVADWLWKNKAYYNGISTLPFNDFVYTQAPFEEITKETFDMLTSKINQSFDITKVIEIEDNTTLKDNLACTGLNCEL